MSRPSLIHRIVLPLLIAVLLAWGRPLVTHAQGQASGSIAGTVVAGGAARAPVAGVPVSLYSVSGAGKTLLASATSDATGAFQFDGINLSAGSQYIASASYLGVAYAVPLPAGRSDPLTITVYATTERADRISIERTSLVLAGVDVKRGLLTIVESYHFTNAGSETYVGQPAGGERRSLQFPLVAGARSLVPLDGFALDEAVATTDGFVLTSPVFPGPETISFTYDVPYRGRAATLRRQFAYPAKLAEVILLPGVQATSPQLIVRSAVQLGGRSFDTIQGAALSAGTPVELKVTGLPARSNGGTNWDSLPVQLAVLLAIVSALAAAVALTRRRVVAGAAALQRERAELLRLVTRLDERAERGTIDREEYARRRQAAFQRLEQVTLQLREAEHSVQAAQETRSSAGTAS